MKKLLFFWNELKSTFWFIPILIILSAVVGAIALLTIDARVDYKPEGILSNIFTGSSESARSILSVIATAMVGVAGTVFSITLVALTLASSQFGSRLLRNFMLERVNQVVLGSYIATYVYCLIVLNTVKDTEVLSFIPTISVFVAIIIAVANIILLIIFIHHIAISIQANKVISDISESLSKSIKRLYPEDLEDADLPQKEPDIEEIKKNYTHTYNIISPDSGYLQYVDYEAMFNKAKHNNYFIELYYMPGDYLVEDQKVGVLYSNNSEKVDDEERDAEDILNPYFIIGNVRIPQQDIEFSIHQMVEVADRALSPGVNDPYTAISCIDNLTATICQLSKVKFPTDYKFDKDGILRVLAKNISFNGTLNTAFRHIRQYSANNPPVAIRLMESLNTIYHFTNNKAHKHAVKVHAEMVHRQAKNSFDEEYDILDLEEKGKDLLPT